VIPLRSGRDCIEKFWVDLGICFFGLVGLVPFGDWAGCGLAGGVICKLQYGIGKDVETFWGCAARLLLNWLFLCGRAFETALRYFTKKTYMHF